jgi:RNA polymerase sigma-70 factor (ECF subfamily)
MALDKFESGKAEVRSASMPDTSLSDHELIDAAKNGDDDAFAVIVSRYRNPITNYLYRFLNDYEEAVDLAQETFVRVYFAIERYHTGFAFSTYIYRIATNLAISELRKRKRRTILSLTGLFQSDSEDNTEFQPTDERSLPDKEFIDDEQGKIIARAIATLPPKYRVPIVLRDIEGKTYEEISAILDLGLGTTKSRISRARGLLKEKLRQYFPE